MSPEDSRTEDHSRGLYPEPVDEGRSRNMRAIKRTDTTAEVALRSALQALGYRFRKDFPVEVPAKKVRPDVVFTRRRVAVFVDGCFWHCCPVHGRQPKINDWYWGPKLARNRERDEEANAALVDAGWIVIRAWEHVAVADVVAAIEHAFELTAQADMSERGGAGRIVVVDHF